MKKRQSRIARIRQLDVRKIEKYTEDVSDSLLGLFESVLRDVEKQNPLYRSADRLKDMATIADRLQSEGLGFLARTLPNLMTALFCYLETGHSSYLGFKKASKAEYPAFLGRLFKEVYTKGQYHDMAFKQIYQVCSLFKKLRGPFRQSSLRKELRKFVEDDESLSRLKFRSDITKPILDNARKLITNLFKGLSVDDVLRRLKPRPGPGATNTPVDKPMRFRPHVVYEQLDEVFWYMEWFNATPDWHYFKHWRRYNALPVKEDAESRFKFVDKYLFKPRCICIEENEMQFFQQAIKGFLYDYLESHPMTRNNIRFTDQSYNQELAVMGSTHGHLATLDMSAASDRISRELVHFLFLDTPLLTLLDTLSTRKINLGDEGIMLAHKFAPMGSGVCFPVMSLVHWALTSSIIKLTSHQDSFRDAKRVYVYGDDLIIPSKYCEAVFTYLPYFGMKLNSDKSFYRGPFRESCGIHAINGVDVTPVYMNYVTKKYHQTSDSTTLLSLLAKESLFHSKGWEFTAQYIRSSITTVWGQLPHVNARSGLLGFLRETPTDLQKLRSLCRKVRYNNDLQCMDMSVKCVVPRRATDTIVPPREGYLRWFLTHCEDAERFGGDVADLRIVRRWLYPKSTTSRWNPPGFEM